MTPSKTVRVTRSTADRANANGARKTRSPGAGKSIGVKPQRATRKPGSTASSVESRLWKLAPKIFRLGGED